MIDINLDINRISNNQNDVSDDDLIKAIKESSYTNQVVQIDYSSDKSHKNIKNINFDDMYERNEFLSTYFNSSIFE